MKKLLRLSFLILLTALCLTAFASAAEGTCGENLTWNFNESTGVLTVSGSGDMWDWSTDADYAAPWMPYADSIRTVVVEEGVTSLGIAAFYSLPNLTAVSLPEGLTEIASFAFLWCRNLTELTLPASVAELGFNPFAQTGLASISVAAGSQHFKAVDGVLFSADGTVLEYYPSARQDTRYEVPVGVKTIGDGAFDGHNYLQEVVLSNSVKTIEERAFSEMRTLTLIDLPAILTIVDYDAFLWTDSLITVFYGDTEAQWQTVEIMEGNDPLLNATILCTDTPLPPAPVSGECGMHGDNIRWTFDETTGCLTLSGSGEMAFWMDEFNRPWEEYISEICSVELQGDISWLSPHSFQNCTALTSVKLNDSLGAIMGSAFQGCTALKSVTLPASLTDLAPSAFALSGLEEITLPGSLEGNMTDRVFLECPSLKKVTLEEGITLIWEMAFAHCPALEEVNLPASLRNIGYFAFGNCPSLKRVNYAGSEAQWQNLSKQEGNDALLQAELVFTAPEFPDLPANVISGTCGKNGDDQVIWIFDPDLGELTIRDLGNVGIMEDFRGELSAPWYDYREQIRSLVVEEGIFYIGSNAFSECSALESVSLPSSLQAIAPHAFTYCFSLERIVIPEGVTEIYSGAFWECPSLREISLPSTLKLVDSRAFTNTRPEAFILAEGCTAFKTVDGVLFTADGTELVAFPGGRGGCYTVPDGVTHIRSSAFESCFSLTEVILPEGVQSIDTLAFQFCGSLNHVSLPASLTTVSRRAFADSPSLSTVTYAGTKAQWEVISVEEENDPLLQAALTCSDSETKRAAVTVYAPAGSAMHIADQMAVTDQDFAVFSLTEGTYDLLVTMAGCLNYTVKNITVGTEDIVLAPIELVRGDTNRDNMINIMDMAAFRQNFGKVGAAVQNPYTDTNGDGMVNIMDMGIFRMNFGKTAAKDCTVEYTA